MTDRKDSTGLAAAWAVLPTNRRDALVGKAKGWAIELWDDHKKERNFPIVVKDDGGKCMRVCDAFSTKWDFAGRLLEEMLEAGVWLDFRTEDMGRSVVIAAPPDAKWYVSEGDSWTDRIALAFCLWKGVEP